MPRFSYTARDNSGTSATGEVTAGSQTDAIQLLRSEGKFIVKIAAAAETFDEIELPKIGGSRVKTDEVIFFCNQLAGMVDTGVPLAEALEATIEGSPQGAFRRTIESVIASVQNGSDLSAALAEHPKAFPPLFVHMVRASEATGSLGTMLQRVSDYMTNQRELRKRIKGALTYPACMILFAVGATLFLLTFVLPQFAAIYADKKAALPMPTLVLMSISDWVAANIVYVALGAVAAGMGAWYYLRTEHGKSAADWMKLNLPIIGPMYRKACLTRALRTWGTMIASGVTVLDAVLITRDVVGNRQFSKVFDDVHYRLERGEQLGQALLNAPYFPRPVWQMLSAGERTGQLGPVMAKVADFSENDLKTAIGTMTQFIEPAMIVIMGTIIGGIAIAMLLPIFQISKVMAH